MVRHEQITAGITRYLDCEILPRLPQWKAIGFGTAVALYLRKLPTIISKFGISNEDGHVDLDAVREELCKRISGDVDIDIPMIGRITIDRSEVDKLYRYIIES